MLKRFNKSSFTIDEQIAHLRDHGMEIADEASAKYWLTHVSYYRLSAYWLFFEKPKGTKPRFPTGTSFEAITELYDFDRKLRRMVMRGTEHVEVALRGSWAYTLAHAGGPHAYLDARKYTDRKEFQHNLSKLASGIATSNETYIRHYRETYGQPAMPPVWMVAEMMSFGQLSRWYSNLADRSIRNQIAAPLGLPETVLVPLVRNITDIRNICAHHGRLWNRGFRAPPKIAHKPADLAQSLDQGATQSPGMIYNSLTMVAHIIRTVAPKSLWASDVRKLLEEHDQVDVTAMGFPANWKDRPLWTT
jgi:abortive infection bacteriophage resistance protein